MANAAYWFRHDSNAKDDFKCMMLIDQLGCEGYGIFWILIETLRDQDGYRAPMSMIPILARKYNTSAEKMKAVVTGYDLFVIDEDDGTFASPQLLKRMGEYDALIAKKRTAGAIGGRKKAALEADINHLLSTNEADAKQMLSTSIANREDRIGEEEKGREEKKKRNVGGKHQDRESAFASLPQTFHNSVFKDESIKFADWFNDKLCPSDIKPTVSMITQWALTWYKLRELDKRDKEHMKEVISWARTDEFWSRNFLTPIKLREKDDQGRMYIDRLTADYEAEQKKGNKSTDHDRPTFSLRVQITDFKDWISVIRDGKEGEEWYSTRADVERFGLQVREHIA
ncbi:DUF4373 domain-containing protein [Chlorobium sp.]|uniref:DUF4373 domain-containing protein n=1 Tax=Chlorobium sp. TaxID=1095 RepID=UPI003C4785EB